LLEKVTLLLGNLIPFYPQLELVQFPLELPIVQPPFLGIQLLLLP
jgi:hypothetical protein